MLNNPKKWTFKQDNLLFLFLMRPYQYRCNDYSLLTPAFKRWVITPLIQFVPWVIPANIITFISNGFVYVGLYLSLNPAIAGDFNPLLIAICLILYLIGDHLDGMQAKRTATGSALGEFCDHYLDAFNNGLIVFTMFTVFQITNPFVISAVMVISYFAHTAVFYEQFKTGWLTFERIGSLEGVLFSALLICLASFQPIYNVLTFLVYKNLTVLECLMLASTIGGIATFIQTIRRVPDVNYNFWIFCLSLLVTAGCCAFLFDALVVCLIITLYASLYIGRVMRAHLVDGVERHADLVTPLYLVLLILVDSLFNSSSSWIVVVYLLSCIIVLIVQVFSVLRSYWVWFNLRT